MAYTTLDRLCAVFLYVHSVFCYLMGTEASACPSVYVLLFALLWVDNFWPVKPKLYTIKRFILI